MKSVATIKLKIPYNELLVKSMKEYSKAISYISDMGFKTNTHKRYDLHHLGYHKTRKKFKLPSQYIINAIRVASQNLKSINTTRGSKPEYRRYMPLDFDKRTFAFTPDKVRVTTVNGRVDIPIKIPEYYVKYLDWSWQTAQVLLDKKQRMFIHIAFSKDVNINTCSNRKVGVDVGMNHMAVTSDKKFFRGSTIKTKMLKFKRLRKKLQAKGTRSSRKLLMKWSGRERRFKAWINHNVSKQIVDSIAEGTIVMENLKGIRRSKRGKRFNYWINNWSFYQLQRFITYKANRKGIYVIKVNPFRTSQICSRCGNIGSRIRHLFTCLHCNYNLNSDLNASFNLAKYPAICKGISASVTEPYIPSDDVKAIFGIATEFRDNQHKSVKPHTSV
ncbi:IS200/IS605 family element transposase accessory protein TnpB [Candidatus Woesearchaeota archaeon]|nr:IS200/IS605 family element transposase accessory protein TnpB [Candidatus Woesearchaeota archaeon]